MKYNKEVISIPASGTIDIIYKYSVHAHPNKEKGYNYKSSKYYTFRRKHGVMEKLFSLEKSIVININDLSEIEDIDLSNVDKKRVINYIKDRKNTFGFNHKLYKFYLLKQEFELIDKPSLPNVSSHCYYKLYELEDGCISIRRDSYYSWTVLTPSACIKSLDKSAFLYRGTGIPRDVINNFGIEYLGKGKKIEIDLIYNNKTYEGRIEIDKQNNPRCRLFWKQDLSKILNNTFPVYYDAVLKHKDLKLLEKPQMKFERIGDAIFIINLLIDKNSKKVDYHSFNELITNLNNQVIKSKSDYQEERIKRLSESNPRPIAITVKTTVFNRNPDVIVEVLERAKGICERCSKPAPFIRTSDGTPYLEVHHIVPLSEGGEDTIENAIAVCPNCHRELHYGAR